MVRCPACGGTLEERFRYCPWCGAGQRLKLVEFFPAAASIADDDGKSLRVSRYIGPTREERHVRFSVWSSAGDRAAARAAVSLAEEDVRRLARFLIHHSAPAPPWRGILGHFRRERSEPARAPTPGP